MMKFKFSKNVFFIIFIILLSTTIIGCSKSNDGSDTNSNPSIATQNSQVILQEKSNSKILESDLLEHNVASDCWVAIGVEVYDITSYISSNLDKNLEEYCGTMFFENVLDSNNIAISQVQSSSVYIGDLE
jgi:hypothetical protein